MPVLVSHFYFTNSLLTARLQCIAIETFLSLRRSVFLRSQNMATSEDDKIDHCTLRLEECLTSLHLQQTHRLPIHPTSSSSDEDKVPSSVPIQLLPVIMQSEKER